MNLKDLTSVEHIVLHCAATKPTMDIGLKEIDLWHRQRGWLMVGYHMIIRRDGTIEWGRPLDKQGAHVRGRNDSSIGICMVGGVNADLEPEDNFTDAQWRAVEFSLEALRFRFPEAEVVGHYQLDSGKACPSFNPKEKGF